MLKTILTALFFSGILLFYLLSLFTVLWVSGDGWLLSLPAFLAIVASLLLRRGGWFFRPRYVRPSQWKLFLALCAVFLSVAVLGGLVLDLPEAGKEALLAPREPYRFQFGSEVSRWRSLAVALSSQLAWHLIGVVLTLGIWRDVIFERRTERAGLELSSPRAWRIFQEDLAKFRNLAAGARRGRLSLSHVKRIRRFVVFALSTTPHFVLLLGLVGIAVALWQAGLLPSWAPGLAIALEFAGVWLVLALDLILSVWERELMTSIWMLLWVAGWGYLTLAGFRYVFAGA